MGNFRNIQQKEKKKRICCGSHVFFFISNAFWHFLVHMHSLINAKIQASHLMKKW